MKPQEKGEKREKNNSYIEATLSMRFEPLKYPEIMQKLDIDHWLFSGRILVLFTLKRRSSAHLKWFKKKHPAAGKHDQAPSDCWTSGKY